MTTSPRRREKPQDRKSEVAALLFAARAVLENRAFADAARAVLSACKVLLAADAGFVAVRGAGGMGLEIALLDPCSLELAAGEALPASLRRLSARAGAAGRTLFSNDLTKNRAARRRPGGPSAPHSALCAPIVIDGEVAGLLGLIDKPGGFAAVDSRLAEVFAEMTAVAMLRSQTVHGLESNRTTLEGKVRDTVTQLGQVEGKWRTENALLLEEAQASSARMQSLSRRLVEVQESERRHIARELHDEAGQALASLRFGLRLLEREADEGGSITGRVAELVQRTDELIEGLHRLAADLRPASLDHVGLEAALREYSRSAGSKYGLAVRFKARGFTGERLPAGVETALYRVVQEAMTNVARHAGATRVDVLVERGADRVLVMVEDDGAGFEPDRVERGAHFGLLGLRERADALGGTLTVESRPGAGTTVVVEVSSADPHPDR
jgi:signal transduction histidine kinase